MTSLIGCPVTPDRIDQCPATPELLPIKSPASTPTSSDNDENDPTRSTTSPPPNCAICLGKCKNKCFTDSCLHQFCFKCLLEWSKIKAECPLCKQSFKSIIHNVKSIDQFEEYLVTQPIQIENLYSNNRIFQYHSHHSSTGQRNNRSYSATVEIHNSNMDLINHADVINRYRQRIPDHRTDSLMIRGPVEQIWRRYIYDHQLYALPLHDVTGRYRECSARFYRDNPAQVTRIMPWLNRDLCILLLNTERDISVVLNVIGDLITIFNINSVEFRRRVTEYIGNRTAHFVHELLNFARSPFDMIGYDRSVQYTSYYDAIIVGTSSDDSDTESFNISQVADRIYSRRLGLTIETRDSRLRIRLDNGNNNANNASTSQTTAINLTTNNNNNNSHILAGPSGNTTDTSNTISGGRPQILGETQVIDIEQTNGTDTNTFTNNRLPYNTVSINNELPINTVSSSSDECEFVLEQKPPHLRTPELVNLLLSDSDSDVIFVGESPIKESKPLLSSSDTESNIDVINHNLKKQHPLSNSSDDTENSLDVTSHNGNSSNKKKNKLHSSKDKKQQNIKIEYNQGASTSSGLKRNRFTKTNDNNMAIPSTSKFSKKMQNKKKINDQKQPILTILGRRSDGRGVKKIYESSSCSTSSSSSSSSSSSDTDDDNDSYKNHNGRNTKELTVKNSFRDYKIKKKRNSHGCSVSKHCRSEKILEKMNFLQKKRIFSIKRNRYNKKEKNDYERNKKYKKKSSKPSWLKSKKSSSKHKRISKSKKRKDDMSSSSSTSLSSSDSESSPSFLKLQLSSTNFSDSDMEPLIKIKRLNKTNQTEQESVTTNIIHSTSTTLTNTNASTIPTSTITSANASNPVTMVEPPLIFSNRPNEFIYKFADLDYDFSYK